jgi:hypothetical protein
MNYLNSSQKAVSLYYAVIITSLLLSIAFGLTTILVGQIKISKEMGDSTIAFFAADNGIEKILYLDTTCSKANCTSTVPFGSLCQEQMNLAGTTTCIGLYNYSTSTLLNNGSEYLAIATTTLEETIFKSKGVYKSIQRAIEATR